MKPAIESATHPYTLIASAIGGRGIPVHWHNNAAYGAYTDNQCIYVPAHDAARSHAFDIIAQALLIRGESLSRRRAQRLLGRTPLTQRYLFAEVVRLARAHQHFLPRSFAEHAAITTFAHRTASAEESYALARSRIALPEPPAFIGSFRGLSILKQFGSSETAQALSKRQQLEKRQLEQTPQLSEDEEENAEESKLLKLFQTPMFGNRALSDLLRNLLGAARSGKADANPGADAGEELRVTRVAQKKRKGMLATLTDFARDLVIADQPEDAASTCYPEWDYSARAYRRRWVLVDELDPWREEPEFGDTLNRLLQPAPAILKRKLAGIGLSLEAHRNQSEGEDFLIDRAIEYCVDVALGMSPNERVYQKNLKTRRDLAIMLLLDVSGSTAELSPQGETIHHRQVRLAWQLLNALHALGDQVALYGYHSWGRSLVRLLRIKSFDEMTIGSRVRERFSKLEPSGYTRTGAALRHAAALLANGTRLPYRMLIVVTDGFAYDHDYEGRYAEEDTKKALQEIRAAGTGCLCITIGSDQEEAKLRDVFSAAATLSARDHDDFIATIRPAVLSAAAQARSSRVG
jgi:nitric oxide reductase NorD protein